MKKLKFAGGITTKQIMEMSTIQKINFVNLNKANWTQSTLRELNFSSTITTKKANSRTQSEIHPDLKKPKKQTQLIIQNNGILSKKWTNIKGMIHQFQIKNNEQD